MSDTTAECVVVPCEQARQFVWIEFALVLIPTTAVLAGDPVIGAIGAALAVLLLIVAIRMARARVAVHGQEVLVRGTWRTRVYPSEAIESVSTRQRAARYWSWAWDGNLPALSKKDLLVMRFTDGSELIPEATRRPPGSGVEILYSVANALGIPRSPA